MMTKIIDNLTKCKIFFVVFAAFLLASALFFNFEIMVPCIISLVAAAVFVVLLMVFYIKMKNTTKKEK